MKILSIVYNKLIYRNVIKSRLKKVGQNFRLGYCSEILNPRFFEIGDNFYSGPYTLFGTNKNNIVTIGTNVMFGPSCKIIGGNHDYHFKENHMMFNKNIDHLKSEIVIEDGVWIGSDSLILSGAHIGEGAVIGAMSLVNNFIPPYCIAVGIPAKKIKKRFEKIDDIAELLNNVKSKYSVNDINTIYKKYKIGYNI